MSMSLCFIKPRCASEPDSKALSLWVGVGSCLVNEIWPFKAVDWKVTTELWAALSMLGNGSSLCPVQPSSTRPPVLVSSWYSVNKSPSSVCW